LRARYTMAMDRATNLPQEFIATSLAALPFVSFSL
jgi:hypothetical protein